MTGALNSDYMFQLDGKNRNETLVKLYHTVHGFIDPAWEREYEEGWAQLLEELRNFVCNAN